MAELPKALRDAVSAVLADRARSLADEAQRLAPVTRNPVDATVGPNPYRSACEPEYGHLRRRRVITTPTEEPTP